MNMIIDIHIYFIIKVFINKFLLVIKFICIGLLKSQ